MMLIRFVTFKMVKYLMRPGMFLSVPEHLGLVINTDGVQTFNSTKHSMWPVFLMIINLPPDVRFLEKFLILAGVWFGPKKPSDMSLILKPVIEKIEKLKSVGISVMTPAGEKIVKTILLSGVFDLPAKASVMNTTQFNGNYGCNYCTDKGKMVMRTHVYPPDDTHQMRTAEMVKAWAKEAQEKNETTMGIKGFSILHGVLNIPFGVPIDYMHAVLEGVTKKLLKFWFATKYHNNPYYLRPYISRIDKEMLRIKPPHEFRRSPRSIESSLFFWKASEYRVFLLFYAVPVLKRFLPSKYLQHLSLLVFAIHSLLSDHINVHDIKQINLCLKRFYDLFPKLYSLDSCTANVHSLIHLAHFVMVWGPLWTHSTFCFENANGVLKRHIHGTRNVLLQCVFMMKMKQYFSIEASASGQNENNHQHIGSKTFIVGKVHKEKLSPTFAENLHMTHSWVFGRVKLKGIIYHSRHHEKIERARNSTIVCFLHDGVLSFADILVFSLSQPPVAVVKKFVRMNGGILDDIDEPDDTCPLDILNNIYYKVKKLSLAHKLIVIPISNIISKCIPIPVKGQEWNYIALQPNHVEHH